MIDGRATHREPGFSYLSQFISAAEARELAAWFSQLHPQWEERFVGKGRLTRPVYWLGAWQFAALGYYSEPDHTEGKCVRAEPLPAPLLSLLERLRPELALHGDDTLPNTALINFYGHTPKAPGKPPVDKARLRRHRDTEPGPVAMFSLGQPAQFEFIERDGVKPVHAQWVRHRSVVIISGPVFKDRLYHRVVRVRHGDQPVLTAQIDDFCIRRISVSFRHVPESKIQDLAELSPESQDTVRAVVVRLAEHSPHFAQQLAPLRREPHAE